MCVLELLRHKSDTVLELLMRERERECSEFNIVCLMTYVDSGSSLVSTSLHFFTIKRLCANYI